MSAERFELSTNGLKGHCSAIELRARVKKTKAEGILTWAGFSVNVRAGPPFAAALQPGPGRGMGYTLGAKAPDMRNKLPVAVHLFFLRDDQILLLRRFNTGYEDGKYSVVAGHVDAGETVTQAAIREAGEEVGVVLQPADLEIVHVMNRKSEDERVDFFMVVRHWIGAIRNNEPQKCDQLAWAALDSLPADLIPYVKRAIAEYQAGVFYSEFGWQ